MEHGQDGSAAAIEARIRATNDLIRDGVAQLDPESPRFAIMCECALEDCVDMLDIDVSEFDRIRLHSGSLIVAPRHVRGEAPEPLEQDERHWVVRRS